MTVSVGIRLPHQLLREGADALAGFAEAVDASGIERVWTGDHVSFRGGKGYDGLLASTAIAAVTRRVVVQTAVYLLPLRHPLPVARQVVGVTELAPGRFVFGVGVGGEDRDEVRNCGVDPSSRGRRMDESLFLVRRLLNGETVDHEGESYVLERASIRPAPSSPPPIIVGGRSEAALRRAGRFADGWLGVWVSPERFAASVSAVEDAAAEAGRQQVPWDHGLLAWCGFADERAAARSSLAHEMESFYGLPFERFERSSPYGTPEDVAEALAPYASSGAATILLSPVASDRDQALECVARVRELLEAAT